MSEIDDTISEFKIKQEILNTLTAGIRMAVMIDGMSNTNTRVEEIIHTIYHKGVADGIGAIMRDSVAVPRRSKSSG